MADYFLLIREDAGIVTDGSVLRKSAMCFLVEFVGVCNLGKHEHDDLSAQQKRLASRFIEQFVQ